MAGEMDIRPDHNVIFKFKQDILQRQALKKYPTLEKCLEVNPLSELKDFYYQKLKTQFADNFISYDEELATAMMAHTLMEYHKNNSAELEVREEEVAAPESRYHAIVPDNHIPPIIVHFQSCRVCDR